MPTPIMEEAAVFRRDLVEVLKQLNRTEEEEPEIGGIEFSELLTHLRRGPCPQLSESDLDLRLATLMANRMALIDDRPVESWERGRVLGRRYGLTPEGKTYLLTQLQRAGRIL
jgi:hypothetical protein